MLRITWSSTITILNKWAALGEDDLKTTLGLLGV
jgi:hypothetical protein